MARNQITITATPQEVFAILADGRSYGHWVVGSSEIRAVDPGWPAVGTRFHHKVGVGPLKVADHTEVLASDPPHRLRLRARARPLGTATIALELSAVGTRETEVVMIEEAGDPLTALVFNRLTDPLVRRRNAESLDRLKAMAEGRGPSMENAADA